jgi:MinD superfamily P-loop ATPase
MPVKIDKEACEGCATCMSVCLTSAIILVETDESVVADVIPEFCDDCHECIESCLRGAITQD